MNQALLVVLILGVAALAAYMLLGKPNSGAGFLRAAPALGLPFSQPFKKVEKPPTRKKSAPLTGKCAKCGEHVTLPFKCSRCGQLFCADHRMPESHGCDT